MVSHAVVLANRLALESGNQLSAGAVARIRKTLEGLVELGVTDVAVVDGRHADELRMRLALHELPSLRVSVLANLSWKNLSGSAVLAGRRWIENGSPCLVVRGDRPLDTQTLRALVAVGMDRPEIDAAIVVATTGASEPGTEVQVKLVRQLDDLPEGELLTVAALGEDLDDSDGVFTGHALVSAAILRELEKLPNPTFEHGLFELARSGRVVGLRSHVWAWAARRPIDVEEKITALLDTKKHGHYMLLNPGPVNTTATVKSALVHHDVCHRDAIFSELMVSLTGKLRRIYRGTPQHTVVAITGSGTAAMESALVSTVPPDKKILIVDNGAFGARLVEVATVHEMDVVHLRYGWGEEVIAADVATALEIGRAHV